jgi:hypothetical protein
MSTAQLEKEKLSPYLKAMVGEGLMKPDVAGVFAQLDSQEKQRLAFNELKKAQVSVAEEVVSKLTWTERKPSGGLSSEVGRRIWKNIRVFRAVGWFLASVAVVPVVFLLILLSLMPWVETVVLAPFRLVEYLIQPLLDSTGDDFQGPQNYSFFQRVFCQLFIWAYLIGLFWVPWRILRWICHLIF